MFKRTLCMAAVAIGLSTVAYADGYGPGPSYGPRYYPTWTGFYAGINSGYGWSDHSDKFSLVAGGFGGIDPQGGFAGGQIGYNWQGVLHPNLVLGVEQDLQASEIKDVIQGPVVGFGAKSHLDYFGTVRGRLGFAFGSSLLYATGGFAYGGRGIAFELR